MYYVLLGCSSPYLAVTTNPHLQNLQWAYHVLKKFSIFSPILVGISQIDYYIVEIIYLFTIIHIQKTKIWLCPNLYMFYIPNHWRYFYNNIEQQYLTSGTSEISGCTDMYFHRVIYLSLYFWKTCIIFSLIWI